MKMYPDDWSVRLTIGAAVAACMAAAWLLAPVVGIHGFWPFMLVIVVADIVGMVLGRLMVGLLLRPSPGGPPEGSKGNP